MAVEIFVIDQFLHFVVVNAIPFFKIEKCLQRICEVN